MGKTTDSETKLYSRLMDRWQLVIHDIKTRLFKHILILDLIYYINIYYYK